MPISMPTTELLPLAAVALATLIASATDLWRFKVYNALTMPTLVAGLIASTLLGGWGGLASGLMGVTIGFGLLVAVYAIGGVGAGDVKLLAAIGAWLGPFLTYQVFVASAFCGAVYAVGLVILRSGLGGLVVEMISAIHAALRPGDWVRPTSTIEAEVLRPDRRRRLVPFAAMTCLGFFATIAWWAGNLDRVWPPDDRGPAISAARDFGPDREVSR